VNIGLLNPGDIKPGSRQLTLFSAEQGIVDNGFDWHTNPSVVINYQLETSEQDIQLIYDVDFTAHNQVDGNEAQVGHYLNRVQAAGSSPELEELVDSLI